MSVSAEVLWTKRKPNALAMRREDGAGAYLRSDIDGRVALRHLDRDPAGVVDHFATDERIDARYRQHNIPAMQDALRRKKAIS